MPNGMFTGYNNPMGCLQDIVIHLVVLGVGPGECSRMMDVAGAGIAECYISSRV